MSGFAMIVNTEPFSETDNLDFQKLVNLTAKHKHLSMDKVLLVGKNYAIAKFAPPDKHTGDVTRDIASGAWLLSVGSVLKNKATENWLDLQDILYQYVHKGAKVLQNLDGAFTLIGFNPKDEIINIVTDPLGFMSVFAAQRGTRIYIASSSLAVAQMLKATPSETGVYTYLTSGGVFGTQTLWTDIRRLPAASIFEVSLNSATTQIHTYWHPIVDRALNALSFDAAVDVALDTLTQLIERTVRSDTTSWVDLTGGFDSRFMAMLMHRAGFAFNTICQGPVQSPDVQISAQIAHEMNWRHKHFSLSDSWGNERADWFARAIGQGDGHLDVFKLSRILKDNDQRAVVSPLAIWGLGGEVWRGFFWRQEMLSAGRTSKVNYDRLVDYRILHPIVTNVFRKPDYLVASRSELKDLLQKVGEQFAEEPNTVKLDAIYAYKNTAHTGAHLSAVAGQQRALAPLFFRSSFETAFSIRADWRQHSRLVRAMLEKANPKLASFSTTAGGPASPMYLTNVHKFAPYWLNIGAQFVRKVTREFLGRSLISPAQSALMTYPLSKWRRDTLQKLSADKVLEPSHMLSSSLYNASHLRKFVEQAYLDEFRYEDFLSRIITIELAFRTAGSSI